MQKHGRRGCISYARHHARRPKHARTSSRDGLRLMTALDEYCHGCPVLASLPLLQIGAQVSILPSCIKSLFSGLRHNLKNYRGVKRELSIEPW